MASDRSRLDYLPGWDDRKELVYEVFQKHCPIPEGVDTRGDFADAIIAVAQWGYQRRFEEVEDIPWPRLQE